MDRAENLDLALRTIAAKEMWFIFWRMLDDPFLQDRTLGANKYFFYHFIFSLRFAE